VIALPIYEVSLEVDAEQVGRLERYMREEHIPAILGTGCFIRISFERSAAGRLRTRYEAVSENALQTYFRDHAGRFRDDFRQQFPHGVVPAREVWAEIERWDSA
jgi:Domain of unknown function (DUF4286)